MKCFASRRRIAFASLFLFTLPPLVWLCGSGSRPGVPLHTLLPAHAPVLLEIHDPKALHDILLHPDANRKLHALDAILMLHASGWDGLFAHPPRPDAPEAGDAVQEPEDAVQEAEASNDAVSPTPPPFLAGHAGIPFLTARLTSLALTHDPAASGAPDTHIVCTVDNLGQALLRLALPFVGEASGAGRRLEVGGKVTLEVTHEGGSLFRIAATTPSPSPFAQMSARPSGAQSAITMQPAPGWDDPGLILSMRMDGRLLPKLPHDGVELRGLGISLARGERGLRGGNGSLLTVRLDADMPASVPLPTSWLRTPMPGGTAFPEHSGLRVAVPASMEGLREAFWTWHHGSPHVPRTGAAEPCEAALDAVLSDLAVASTGGVGVELLLCAPPPPAEDYGVLPAPKIALAWRAHPEPERVADALDRAMSRLARMIREVFPHPLARHMLGRTEWKRHPSGEPGGTLRVHPVLFHHLAPGVGVREGRVLLSTHPLSGDSASLDAPSGMVGIGGDRTTGAGNAGEGRREEGNGGVGIRLVWHDDGGLRACLGHLVTDYAIQKGLVERVHRAGIRQGVSVWDEFLQAWPVFEIRGTVPDASTDGRVRVEWGAPFP